MAGDAGPHRWSTEGRSRGEQQVQGWVEGSLVERGILHEDNALTRESAREAATSTAEGPIGLQKGPPPLLQTRYDAFAQQPVLLSPTLAEATREKVIRGSSGTIQSDSHAAGPFDPISEEATPFGATSQLRNRASQRAVGSRSQLASVAVSWARAGELQLFVGDASSRSECVNFWRSIAAHASDQMGQGHGWHLRITRWCNGEGFDVCAQGADTPCSLKGREVMRSPWATTSLDLEQAAYIVKPLRGCFNLYELDDTELHGLWTQAMGVLYSYHPRGEFKKIHLHSGCEQGRLTNSSQWTVHLEVFVEPLDFAAWWGSPAVPFVYPSLDVVSDEGFIDMQGVQPLAFKQRDRKSVV